MKIIPEMKSKPIPDLLPRQTFATLTVASQSITPQIIATLCAGLFLCLMTLLASAQAPDDFYDDGDLSGEDGQSAPAEDRLPPANLTTGPTPIAIWQLAEPDFQPLRREVEQLAEFSKMPKPPLIVGPALRNEAHIAFRYGNLRLAHELFFAHLTGAGKAAIPDLEKLKFSPYFRRPVWTLRWAVSLGLHGDTDVTDYSPIRADGRSGDDGGGMDDFGGPNDFDDFGDRGRSRGGRPPEDDMEEFYEEMDDFDRPGDGRETLEIAIPDPEMTDPQISERFDELMGSVATTVAEGLETRFKNGQFGPALIDVAPEATDQGHLVGGEVVTPGQPRMWVPGIVYLGEGGVLEMTKTAAKENIELLLHFDVALKEFRGGPPQNLTRVKVVDCKSGKTVVLSGAMDSREVQRIVQANRGTAESHIAEGLDKFWSVLDSKINVTEFPKLTAEIARKRVTGLLADSSLSILRKLAEIRYLGHVGLLTDEEVEQAFDIAIGADGMTILYGSPADATSVLREIALQSVNQSS
ncbi:hypothetical protein [Aporhodopirellula aestuarii]|uniref:Uncharacterized protein n=1 Tax=Aporhodopirellula aestuarii TaxID=2950107 RepID=A0ABT0U1G0_9BACT|nr:hypothetical protein [Aporhodopirellula aestuarii]MCM2370328.1 hypothetical protein [Aporhodopirellula aestuarii]